MTSDCLTTKDTKGTKEINADDVFGIVLEPIRVILAELSMNFGITTDYALGKIFEFRLRALRVLRGDYLSSASQSCLGWRTQYRKQ